MTTEPKKGYGILLVEDNECVAETKKDLLERHGHSVLLYYDGLNVLDDLGKMGICYSIAVVDRQLGEISGDEVIRALKKEYPERPIICASASPYGVGYTDASISKPFTISELDQLIRELMSRKP